MTAATRRKVNPSAKARANAAAARRRNFNLPLRSRFRFLEARDATLKMLEHEVIWGHFGIFVVAG